MREIDTLFATLDNEEEPKGSIGNESKELYYPPSVCKDVQKEKKRRLLRHLRRLFTFRAKKNGSVGTSSTAACSTWSDTSSIEESPVEDDDESVEPPIRQRLEESGIECEDFAESECPLPGFLPLLNREISPDPVHLGT